MLWSTLVVQSLGVLPIDQRVMGSNPGQSQGVNLNVGAMDFFFIR